MHLSRRIWAQLIIFGIISVTATTDLAVEYAHAPAHVLGIGRYEVTVEMTRSAGLYPRANITYRGSTVGQVDELRLTATGVEAVLSLHSGVDIPDDVEVAVHSQSPIGEQYIALNPRTDRAPYLRAGSILAADRVTIPPDVNELLDKTNSALLGLPNQNAKTLVDESFTAFGGLGPELSRVVDGTTKLTIDAKEHLDDIKNVVDNAAPLLDAQTRTSDAVGAWAEHLASITGSLQRQDAAVSGVLRDAGPAADEARQLVERLQPTLPVLLANLVSVTQVAIVFRPNIEQILVLYPQNIAETGATLVPNLNTKQPYAGPLQNFSMNVNLPPPCVTGYLPASQHLAPAIEDPPARPEGDFYCRIPQDATNVVRGARNIPCETKPWKRAPTVWMCEGDEEYVPLNDGNAWKGDPNATLSGQGVPQLPPDQRGAATPDGTPPPSTPPAALGVADYNAANGTYVGPDGAVYTQTDLAQNAPVPTLRSMLFPPSGQ